MNIQSNLKNILDKFPKDEVKLASHKVELTAIQDIKGVSNLDTALGKLESEAKFLRAAIKTAKQEL